MPRTAPKVAVNASQLSKADRCPASRSSRKARRTSAGSDDHGSLTGHRIGSHTAPAGAYESLIAQATGSRPVRSG